VIEGKLDLVILIEGDLDLVIEGELLQW